MAATVGAVAGPNLAGTARGLAALTGQPAEVGPFLLCLLVFAGAPVAAGLTVAFASFATLALAAASIVMPYLAVVAIRAVRPPRTDRAPRGGHGIRVPTTGTAATRVAGPRWEQER